MAWYRVVYYFMDAPSQTYGYPISVGTESLNDALSKNGYTSCDIEGISGDAWVAQLHHTRTYCNSPHRRRFTSQSASSPRRACMVRIADYWSVFQ